MSSLSSSVLGILGRARVRKPRLKPLLLSALLLAPPCGVVASEGPAVADDDHGVYLLLAQELPYSVEQAVKQFVDYLDESPWKFVAGVQSGIPTDLCAFPAEVIVLESSDHTEAVLSAGLPGAFAVPVRVVVFEDEFGVHVGATNPMSLNRTMVAEEGMEEEWLKAAESLRAIATAAFPEHTSTTEYGQERDKGRIGRTFGIMAGGPFPEKLTEVIRVPSGQVSGLEGAAQALMEGMGEVTGEWEWQLRPVFNIGLTEHGFAVVGVTGGPMETKSFEIVGTGGNDARKACSCPGIDHAAAYPLEVVLAAEGDEVAVYVVNEMFRMKMYFEDAGKMAFATNMGMPGSIEDELKDKIRAVLR
jgi:hypothetical protein